MREQDVSDRLGELFKGIYVPVTVATSIVENAAVGRRLGRAGAARAAGRRRAAPCRPTHAHEPPARGQGGRQD
jgi:hypothetical protein